MSQNLPSISDLVSDKEVAIVNDQFKLLLNQEPHAAWVKRNKFANNAAYVPIDKVEYLLDKIFQEWKIEVLQTKIIFNAISITVRLHYKNPITSEWSFHDGVSAKELQTVSKSGPLKPDFSNVSKSAVEMALPIAKSTALKDACHHLGKLFGRDLNRKDSIMYETTYQETNETKEVSLITLIGQCNSLDELTALNEKHSIATKGDQVLKLFKAKWQHFNDLIVQSSAPVAPKKDPSKAF